MKHSKRLKLSSIVIISLFGVGCGENNSVQNDTSNTINMTPPTLDVIGNTFAREASLDIDHKTEDYINGLNKFSFEYFINATSKNQKENFVFSPLSISSALSIVYLGAKNNSAEQIKELFHTELDTLEFFQQANTVESTLLNSNSKEKTDLSILNSLWGEKSQTYQSEFLENLSKYFGIGINAVDFLNNANNVIETANNWVEAKTEGNIKEIIPQGGFTSSTRLAVINSVHFKAEWQSKFNVDNTKLHDFTLLDNTSVETLMMEGLFQTKYSQKAGVSIVELPFSDGDWSLIILWPNINDFESLSESLTSDLFKEYIDDLESAYVQLKIPKFTIDTSNNIKENLAALGITDIFEQSKSDLSGIFSGNAESIYVDNAYHNAVIDFNEEGVEAAASTAITLIDTNQPTNISVVNIDSPFIFAIRHNELGVVLFVGETIDPR